MELLRITSRFLFKDGLINNEVELLIKTQHGEFYLSSFRNVTKAI
jgi:hypothetical protein